MRTPLVFVMLATLSGCASSGSDSDAGGGVTVDSGTPVQDTGTSMTDTGTGTQDTGTGTQDTGTSMTDTGIPSHNAGHTDAATTAADVQLMSTPGHIFCFSTPACSGATPVCCDASADGGFTDTCVANLAACAAPAHAFVCEETADCMGGQVCCTHVGMSSRGTPFIDATTCAASCTGATTQQLCKADSGCPSGMHCMAQRISGRNIGICM